MRKVATAVGDHDWYPWRRTRRGSTASRARTIARASTATGWSPRLATDQVSRSDDRDHSRSIDAGSLARTSTRPGPSRIGCDAMSTQLGTEDADEADHLARVPPEVVGQ